MAMPARACTPTFAKTHPSFTLVSLHDMESLALTPDDSYFCKLVLGVEVSPLESAVDKLPSVPKEGATFRVTPTFGIDEEEQPPVDASIAGVSRGDDVAVDDSVDIADDTPRPTRRALFGGSPATESTGVEQLTTGCDATFDDDPHGLRPSAPDPVGFMSWLLPEGRVAVC